MTDFSKMSINELIDFAKMNSIDISAIHTGKGFRSSQGKKYNKSDLVTAIQISSIEQGTEETMEQGIEETMEQGTEETMEQGTEELDFDNTSIVEYKDFAIKQDASLSHILNKVYGFLNNKTDFVRFICQLLKVDESKFIPTKEYQEVKIEKTDYDEKKEKMFNNIYQRFSDFINYLCINNIAYDYPKFNSLIDDTAIDIYNFTLFEGKDNSISPFTLSNNLSELKTYLIPKILKDNKSFPNNILISNFVDLFNSIKSRKEIKDNLIEKRNITNTHVNQRQSNILYIECHELIIWAKNTLKQLMDNSFWDKKDRKIKAKWTDIAIALMIVTGRRSSEIMSSAKFTQIDYYHVNFIGQLKGNSYSLTPIKIPVLINSELVILGLEWLEFMGKREKSDFTIDDDITIKNKAKKAHQRFSRYLNESVKKIFSDNVSINNNGEIILNYDDGYKKNRANCHLMRQIYSQIAYQIFYYNKQIGKKKHFVLAEILGHENNEQNAKKASENYDSDFEITDYDKIGELIGY